MIRKENWMKRGARVDALGKQGTITTIANTEVKPRKVATADELFKLSDELFGVPLKTLISQNRETHIKTVRHIVVWYAVDKLEMTLNGIGFLIDRDHSTVSSSRNRIRNVIESPRTNRPLHEYVELFLSKIDTTSMLPYPIRVNNCVEQLRSICNDATISESDQLNVINAIAYLCRINDGK